MLKEYAQVFKRVLVTSDLAIVSLSFFLGYAYRANISPFEPVGDVIGYLPLLIAIWGVLLHYFGMYESCRTARISRLFFIILKTTVFGFFVFNSITYFLKVPYLSRMFVVFIFGFSALLIGIEKLIMIFVLRYARKKGLNYRNILIIGTGKRAQNFIDVVHMHSEWGLRIFGLVDDNEEMIGNTIRGYKVIGKLSDVADIIHSNVIDEIVIVVPRSWLVKLEDVIRFCETEGHKIHLAVDYFDLQFARAKQTELNGLPLLTFESTPDKIWHLLLKRSLDILLSGVALIISFPLFLIISVLIKMTSKGAVFFKQIRCGLNGREFVLYKFRTMDEDAEERLAELRRYNEMDGPVFKMKNDPRLTKVGAFLRKTSLDELPQLWNVFKGNMSIVGPRPPIPNEVNKYEPWHRRRLSMRPGITCLWQVNGRNNISDFNKWIKLDLDYIDHWSLWLDCKIMFKTVPTVLMGIGAK